MKKALYILTITAVLAAVYSCNDEIEIPEAYLTALQDKMEFPAEGGVQTMTVKASSLPDVYAEQEWVNIETRLMKNDEYSVTVTVEPNPTSERRGFFVRMRNEEKHADIPCTQSCEPVRLENVTWLNGYKEHEVTRNISIITEGKHQVTAAVTHSENADVSVSMKDELTAEVTFTLHSDIGKTTIEFTNGIHTTSREYILEEYSLVPSPAEMMKSQGGQQMLVLDTDVPASNYTINSDSDWLTVTGGNESSVMIECTPNDGDAPRTAVLSIVDNVDGYEQELWTIKQTDKNHVWFRTEDMNDIMTSMHDADDDGYISLEEAETITTLDLRGKKVKSIEGLSALKNLETLDICGTGISHADLSDLGYNRLRNLKLDESTSADVTGCRLIMNVRNEFNERHQGGIIALNTQHFEKWKPEITEEKYDDYHASDFSMHGVEKTVRETVRHMENPAFDITFIIDIYGLTDRDIDSGVYDEIAGKIEDAIFEIEPAKSFREYVTIIYRYSVASQRKIEGVERPLYDWAPKQQLQERHVRWIDVYYNYEKFRAYAFMDFSCAFNYDDNYENMWPVVQHEAIGHMIGYLADEYIENDETFPENTSWGAGPNVVQSTNLEDLPQWWQELASYPEYHEELTTFYEGCARYRYGLWHTGENNIMNFHYVPSGRRFSAIQRFLIWEHFAKIKNEIPWKTTEEKIKDFVEYDKINLTE